MPPLIKNLSSELTQELLNRGIRKSYSAHQQIFAETEEALFLPIVLSGSVKLVRYPASGKELVIGVFRAGEIFAIPPAVDGKIFPATAVALEETELLLVARPEFLGLLKESEEFSSVIMTKMCGILRDRANTVQILATPSSEHRVGTVLLQLAQDGETASPVVIKLRRQDIAEMAGLTTETTIRTIRHLAEKGLVRIIRRKIVIEDPTILRDFLK